MKTMNHLALHLLLAVGLGGPLLSAHAAEPDAPDQEQPDLGYGFWFEARLARWQEFIPNLATVTAVDLHIRRDGRPGDVVVELRGDRGADLLASAIVPEDDVPASGWLRVDLGRRIPVTPGETYRIYVSSTADSNSVDDRYYWHGEIESDYCLACESDPSADGGWTDYAYAFRTHGEITGVGALSYSLDPATLLVRCVNRSTGQTVQFTPLHGRSWDCEASGLLVAEGDLIDLQVRGFSQ